MGTNARLVQGLLQPLALVAKLQMTVCSPAPGPRWHLRSLLLPTLCPFPHPLFYPALPPASPCSESSCLHHGGHDEENLFTSDCSAHAAAGVWERAETRLPGSHPASRLYPGTSAPQQPSPWGERFFPGSYSLVGRKAFNLELQLIICRVGQFRLC